MSANPMLAQAMAAYGRGNIQQAGQLCDQVLRTDKKNVNALLLAADVAQMSGDRTRSKSHLNQVLRVSPRNAQVRAKVGHLLSRDGDYAKATDQFRKALQIDPTLVEARVGMATAYERQGRHDKAREQLRGLDDTLLATPEVAVIQIRLLLEASEVEDAIALGERARVGGTDATPTARWRLQLELARAYEDAGRFDDAFGCAAEANALHAQPFDRTAHRQRLDHLKQAFSAERMRQLPKAATAGERPIFIVGMPRSGSTLLDRTLHAHPEAFGIGEQPIVHHLAYTLHTRLGAPAVYPGCMRQVDQAAIDAVREDYLGEARRHAGRAKRTVDKMLGNFLHLGFIATFAPDAKVIHCHRDPMDNCLSCFMSPLAPAAVPYAARLDDLGVYYRVYEDLMQTWRTTLDIDLIDIKYEDLIANQEAVTRRVLDFCELPWHDGCLRFHEVKRAEATLSFNQVRRPLYRSSVGRAERFAAGTLAPLREQLGIGV